MNSIEHHPNGKSLLRRRVAGSALSAFVGWFALNAFLFVWAFITRAEHRSNPPMPNEWLVGPYFFAIGSAAFVFVTWLVALLPLYIFVPQRSVLWRWPICTLCGSIAGALIMFTFSGTTSADRELGMIILASIVGGITCLFGALTADRFHHAPSATTVA